MSGFAGDRDPTPERSDPIRQRGQPATTRTIAERTRSCRGYAGAVVGNLDPESIAVGAYVDGDLVRGCMFERVS